MFLREKDIERLYDRAYLTEQSTARRRQFARIESEKATGPTESYRLFGLDPATPRQSRFRANSVFVRARRLSSISLSIWSSIAEDAEQILFYGPKLTAKRVTWEVTTKEQQALYVKGQRRYGLKSKGDTAINKRLRQHENSRHCRFAKGWEGWLK